MAISAKATDRMERSIPTAVIMIVTEIPNGVNEAGEAKGAGLIAAGIAA